MIHYLPICFILAILGTLLGNPAFYYSLFLSWKKRNEHLKGFRRPPKDCKTYCKRLYSIYNQASLPISLLIGQVLTFVILFLLSTALYFKGAVVVTFSTILAYLWMPAIPHLVWFVLCSLKKTSFCYNIEETIKTSSLIIAIVFFAIPIAIGCHKGIYNYLYPNSDITFMEENDQEYPTVDETILLKGANFLATGASLKSPVYRNGNWIYPVVNTSSHVDTSGYLVADNSNKNITFVPKNIIYSPWILSINHISLVARRLMPSKVLWGPTSLQIEPKTGDIYFGLFYGDYACLRAGRKVEGVILINASNGVYCTHPMDEIPDWVTGISF